MRVISSNSEYISCFLTDLPIAIIQLDALIIREMYSRTVISSLLMLIFSIGGAVKMIIVSALLCQCLEYQKIPVIAHFSNVMKLHCAFNPCYTATQLLRNVLKNLQEGNDESIGKQATFEQIERSLTGLNNVLAAPASVSLSIARQKSLEKQKTL